MKKKDYIITRLEGVEDEIYRLTHDREWLFMINTIDPRKVRQFDRVRDDINDIISQIEHHL